MYNSDMFLSLSESHLYDIDGGFSILGLVVAVVIVCVVVFVVAAAVGAYNKYSEMDRKYAN